MEEIFRLVSNANKSEFPENTSNSFTNDLHPSIFNAKSLGILKISVEIDYSKIEKDNKDFLNDNCYFFVNCDQSDNTRIANQSVNSLNDFFIDLTRIKKNTRIVKVFESDFLYVNLLVENIEKIYILITNLNGEPHPCLTGATIISLKFSNMSAEQTTFRAVSSANKSEFPENNAAEFSNSCKPSILNVDSVALTKISIPLAPSTPKKLEFNESFNSDFVTKATAIAKEIFLGYAKVITNKAGFLVNQPLTMNIPTGINLDGTIAHQNRNVFMEGVELTRMYFVGWELGSKLTPHYNFKFEQNKDNPTFYHVYCIIGPEFVKQGMQVTSFWLDSKDVEGFAIGYPRSKILFSKNPNSYKYQDNDWVIRDAFQIFFGDIDDYNTNEKPEPEDGVNDLIFVLLDNCEYISFGSKQFPIIGVIPVTEKNTFQERITFDIPFSNIYFLRTNSDIINNFSIRLVNRDMKNHPRVIKDKSTIATFIINHGSNTEVRESNHFGQLIGQ